MPVHEYCKCGERLQTGKEEEMGMCYNCRYGDKESSSSLTDKTIE